MYSIISAGDINSLSNLLDTYVSCLSLLCCLVRFLQPVTCLERAYLLALLCVVFSCDLVTFPSDFPGLIWYLIVSIPDLCLPLYFKLKYYIHIYVVLVRCNRNKHLMTISFFECSGYGMGHAWVANAVGTEWVTPGLPMQWVWNGSCLGYQCSGYGMGHAWVTYAVGTEWVTPGLPMQWVRNGSRLGYQCSG